MSWSKLKQNLDGFLSPALNGKVEYRSTSYRYLPDKGGLSYMAVDKKNVFNMTDVTGPIKWYKTELEIKNDPDMVVPISDKEIEAIRTETKGAVPEERLRVIARNRKMTEHAKELLSVQAALSKSNFVVVANRFLSSPIEESLESRDILLNILALVDKRVGKKRLINMKEKIKAKHPVVRYFYEMRLDTF